MQNPEIRQKVSKRDNARGQVRILLMHSLANVMSQVVRGLVELDAGHIWRLMPVWTVRLAGVLNHRGVEVVDCEGRWPRAGPDIEGTYSLLAHRKTEVIEEHLKSAPGSGVAIKKMKP